MGDKDDDFKVIDRRFSAGGTDSKKEKAKGDGFVMKEGKSSESKATPPAQIDFSTFVFSLATGAIINLGLSPDPISKKVVKDVGLAKQNIDILELLKDKTSGNLTEEEDKLLESLLTEVRLKFVEASRT